MGKRGVKRKKARYDNPPLSFVDKIVYFLLAVFSMFVCGFIVYLFFKIKRSYILKNPDVIGYIDKAGFLYCAFPCTVSVLSVILWIIAYAFHKPVFGDKNIKYGSYEYRGIYPLFYKNKPERTEKQKALDRKGRRYNATAVSLVLIVSALISLTGFFPRTEIYDTYALRDVDMFNNTKQTYMPNDIREISIISRIKYDKNDRDWIFEMEPEYRDGKKYCFRIGTFQGEREERIKRMIEFRELVPDSSVKIIMEADLEMVAADMGLSPTEEELLYKLFEK